MSLDLQEAPKADGNFKIYLLFIEISVIMSYVYSFLHAEGGPEK